MHKWLLAAALVLFLAVPVTAQPTEYGFTEDYLARVGVGDLSLVDGTEPADAWTVAEYVRFGHDGNQTTLSGVPDERFLVDCTCVNFTVNAGTATVGSDVAAGDYVLRLVRSIPGEHLVARLALFDTPDSSRLVAYVPTGMEVLAGARAIGDLVCTGGGCLIQEVAPIATPDVAMVPQGVIVPAPAVDDDDGMFGEWGPAILGILVGIALWSYLVSKGVVQKRRKQEVAKAAHVEAAATESQDTLAARKRVLMAGLKELEKAKMTKEIETDVYDALKAELKKETVIVMRALEAAE